MDTPITRAEHAEFCRRMESENKRLKDENDRQNARIAILEELYRENTAMVANVERLAVNMENMLKEQESMRKEQENQGKRLADLEGRDGKSWRELKSKIISTVVSVLGGAMIGAVMTLVFK